MERNADSPIASSDAEAALGGADAVNDTPGIARHGTTPGNNLPPGPVVEERSRGGMVWLFIALVVAAVLIYLAKGMI
jgi:hypothetical protein